MNRIIGELEELILLAVCILDGYGYGFSVKKEADRQTGRSILLGAVHITLYRLQDKACPNHCLAAALRTSQEIRQKMWDLIPQLNLES